MEVLDMNELDHVIGGVTMMEPIDAADELRRHAPPRSDRRRPAAVTPAVGSTGFELQSKA